MRTDGGARSRDGIAPSPQVRPPLGRILAERARGELAVHEPDDIGVAEAG